MLNPVSSNLIHTKGYIFHNIKPAPCCNNSNREISKNFSLPGYDNYNAVRLGFCGKIVDTIDKALILSPFGETPLNKRPDGGYLIDANTNTVIYYGKEAKNFLKDSTYFNHDTEIICQSDCNIEVKPIKGDVLSLSEPGAVLINKGTYATIEKIEGNLLVVTSEKRPEWYSKLSPFNEHRAFFEALVDKNRHIYAGHIPNTLIKDEYKQLEKEGIIKEVGNEYCEFHNIKDREDLKNKLEKLTFNAKQKAEIENIWDGIQERKKFSYQNPGSVILSDFENLTDSENIYNKLCENDILQKDKTDLNKAQWSKFYKVEELKKDIESINDKDLNNNIENIIKIWGKTTKSGYDITGLTDEAPGITVYVLKKAFNQWLHTPTEWITNSTNWTKKVPFDVGVSRIHYNDPANQLKNINEVRMAEETIHHHSHKNINNYEDQLEGYLVTQGKVAFCIKGEGKKKIRILDEGELLIIPGNVEHALLALQGEYEHLVCQVPSTFHYGFQFKVTTDPIPRDWIDEAKNILKNKDSKS